MKVLNTGREYTINPDDSLEVYDEIPAGMYRINKSNTKGLYLERVDLPKVDEEAVYGNVPEVANRVLGSYFKADGNFGVILTGTKGTGKSLCVKLMSNSIISKGIPVIRVDFPDDDLMNFIEDIDQDCMVVFDEFEKRFYNKDEQEQLLSMFDGVCAGSKLFVIVSNNLNLISRFLLNRPGRFRYHFRFDPPDRELAREYLEDSVNPKYRGDIEAVLDFHDRAPLSFDALDAISFELNSGATFKEAIKYLNILDVDEHEYQVFLQTADGDREYIKTITLNMFQTESFSACCTSLGECWLELNTNRALFDAKSKEFYIPSSHITNLAALSENRPGIEDEIDRICLSPTYKNHHYLI